MIELSEQQKQIMKGMICPYCKKPSVFIKSSEEIYGVDYGPAYICRSCHAYCGCHPGTTKPLGRLANKRLRKLKVEAHFYFDQIWKSRKMNRKAAYKWLSEELLNIPCRYAHIGMLNEESCRKVIAASKKYLKK